MYPTLSYMLRDLAGIALPFSVHTFAFFAGVAILLSYFILVLELKRKTYNRMMKRSFDKHGYYRKSEELAAVVVMLAVLFGITGARLFSIAENPQPFFEAPFYVLFSEAGFTFYGGLIIGAAAIFVYARRVELDLKHLLDAAAPAIIFGYAIGRLGGHLSGDGNWGIENVDLKPGYLNFLPDWLWAYNYPHNSAGQGVLLPDCQDGFCKVLANPVFPVALYEFIFCSLVFIALWTLRKKLTAPGLMFSIYLMITGTWRLFIGQIRPGEPSWLLGLKMGQAGNISVLLIIAGALLFYTAYTKQKQNTLIYYK